MEQDEETMAGICGMLKTGAGYVKNEIAAPQKRWKSKEESIGAQSRMGHQAERQAEDRRMTVKEECRNTGLIGGRIVKQLKLLGGSSPALLDTGSMSSVVPANSTVKARDRGFDVDALKLVEKSQFASVWDASIKRMDFLGAVHVEAKLEGGNRGLVPFHISPSKEDMIILGTNALRKLGVELSIVADKKGSNKQWTEGDESNATVPTESTPNFMLLTLNINDMEEF
ncbi:hypothetical protein OSTOST_14561 [Ostertagia ostertagi]